MFAERKAHAPLAELLAKKIKLRPRKRKTRARPAKKDCRKLNSRWH